MNIFKNNTFIIKLLHQQQSLVSMFICTNAVMSQIVTRFRENDKASTQWIIKLEWKTTGVPTRVYIYVNINCLTQHAAQNSIHQNTYTKCKTQKTNNTNRKKKHTLYINKQSKLNNNKKRLSEMLMKNTLLTGILKLLLAKTFESKETKHTTNQPTKTLALLTIWTIKITHSHNKQQSMHKMVQAECTHNVLWPSQLYKITLTQDLWMLVMFCTWLRSKWTLWCFEVTSCLTSLEQKRSKGKK